MRMVELEEFKMKEQPGQQEEQTLRPCTEKEESSCVTGGISGEVNLAGARSWSLEVESFK